MSCFVANSVHWKLDEKMVLVKPNLCADVFVALCWNLGLGVSVNIKSMCVGFFVCVCAWVSQEEEGFFSLLSSIFLRLKKEELFFSPAEF